MQKQLYAIIMHWDVYFKEWEPIAVLEDPQEVYAMVSELERDMNGKVTWGKIPNTFSIGTQDFKVHYAYRYYVLTSKE